MSGQKKKEKQGKTTEDIEYERSMKECTFKPNLPTSAMFKTARASYGGSKDPSVQKTVERMRKAREETEAKQKFLEPRSSNVKPSKKRNSSS